MSGRTKTAENNLSFFLLVTISYNSAALERHMIIQTMSS